MKRLDEELPEDVLALQALVRHQREQLAKYEAQLKQGEETISTLQAQINVLLAKRYGSSSEQLNEAQLKLFDEAEAACEEDEVSESEAGVSEVAGYRRGKPTRKPLPEALERVVIEHVLDEAERRCAHHGVELERFGEVTSEQLDIVPATVRVLRHVRGKYRCACCEGVIRTAPMPPQPIAKSLASAGTLAYVATAKYVDALPLYRQQQQFKRLGVSLSRTTLASWMVRVGRLVQPLINLLRDELLSQSYLLMDETRVQVLKEPGKSAQSTSYLWAQMSGEATHPIVLFDYDPTRSGDVPMRLLEGFEGALHTDGYSGYDAVVKARGLERLFCWVHARRRFVDVLKSLELNPQKLPSKPPPKARRALKAIDFIKSLYAIESRIRDKPPDERYRERQRYAKPILTQLRQWLDKTRDKIVPSGPLGEALAYLDAHWAGLVRYCNDGRYGMDTNRVENAIRPFCLGRRVWLFSDSVAGAKSSANLYSLIQTAKLAGLEPYAYLRLVFDELPKARTVTDIEALLPARIDPTTLRPQALP